MTTFNRIHRAEQELVAEVKTRLTHAERDLSDGFRRWRLWVLTHPVRGLMDATAALLFLGAVIWLWMRTERPLGEELAIAVYGLAVVSMFVVSALYHAVPWSERAKGLMQRLDHTMIFVLVAGTYTPIAVIALDGAVRVVTLSVVWGVVAVGTIEKWAFTKHRTWLSISLMAAQGWFGVLLLIPLLRNLPSQAVLLTVIGGVLYTIGMVVLVSRRPFLWPRVFSYHEVMHVFVIAAAGFHFVMIATYVAPTPVA